LRFEEFIKSGIIKKHSPDYSRAAFLVEETKINRKFLLGVEINVVSANSVVKLAYDIIMGFLRAKMLQNGYHAVGNGAHKAEVLYLKKIGISDADIRFADQLRRFRNGMLYYGRMMDMEYAKKVVEFMERICSVIINF